MKPQSVSTYQLGRAGAQTESYRPTIRRAVTDKPCVCGCGKPIQPGQLYTGGPDNPRLIGH